LGLASDAPRTLIATPIVGTAMIVGRTRTRAGDICAGIHHAHIGGATQIGTSSVDQSIAENWTFCPWSTVSY
jgi:hypothetical protein